MFLVPADYAAAQTQPKGDASFFGVKINDRVGKSGALPDGKPDAVFSLTLPAEPDLVITQIDINAAPSGLWSTSASPGASFLGVASSKTPSRIINHKPGPIKISLKGATEFLLFVTDDGSFSDPDRHYQIKLVAANGQSWIVPVRNELSEKPDGKAEAPAGGPVKMTAVNRGISEYDAVNPGKELKADDVPDGLFQLTVEAKDKTITALEIRKTDGTASLWDTIPGAPAGAIGVALTSDPIRLLNHRDGTVSLPVRDRVDLNLYVGDNGEVAVGKANFRIAVTFSDGEIAWCPVQLAAAGSAPKTGLTKVNFLATWLGPVNTDAVGKYPGLNPDGLGDTVFGLDIEVEPRSTITGIELNRADGMGAKWATAGVNPTAWGLAVAYQTAEKTLLNKPDGTVSIPIEGRAQLYVYAADPGDISSTFESYRMIVRLSDGSYYQQPVRRPVGAASTVAPKPEEEPKAKGDLRCDFKGFILDLVNKSTKPGKDGYLDATFVMRLQSEEKKITKIEISGIDGQVRWSTDPKPDMSFLGAAIYPKIYNLVNERPGPLHLPVTGKRTFYLYAADNGMLSDPKAGLFLTVTFADKTTLKTEIIK